MRVKKGNNINKKNNYIIGLYDQINDCRYTNMIDTKYMKHNQLKHNSMEIFFFLVSLWYKTK